MQAIGNGHRTDIDATDALVVARDASPSAGRGVDRDDPLGLAAGRSVSVTPDDYGRIPVLGELVTLTLDEVAIRRSAPEVGEVVVHFPRTGYRIERAA
jgi:hypothetical protein